ncbi:MAG: glycosyl hydrolase [Chloracidobacterium sp.]|nr:glycosyl hydrolase [Chloracidobacterium sp.]MDW8218040.1 glycosyl hydrolase [Acidobacteriota bacterium]
MFVWKPHALAALGWCCLLLIFGTAQERPAAPPAATTKTAAPPKLDSSMLGAWTARAIGPATMSGRIAALDVVNTNPKIIYVGAASGGVWKSSDGGLTFKPVFDKHTQSIGAIAIDQTRPDTVWVGTGEGWTRNSVSVGTGLYKTTDGGETWTRVGLEKTERIARIVIDPRKSDTVYVAALGPLWASGEERGLYKTTDGGKTWTKILYINADTGCADVAIDPQEPDILYAAMWQFRRLPWTFTSGGPGSGLHKSTDGGKTWKKLTKGLPEGELGRIAVAVAPSRPNTVYANVESRKTALYVSDDLGESWTKVNDVNASVKSRPFYFSLVVVDPKHYRRVYKPATTLARSEDGGKTFEVIAGGTHSDHHALWINPNNSDHLLLGTDGGVYESKNGGRTFRLLRSLPVSQFYHVAADNARPYNVYGGLQDNGTWMAPSHKPGGITNADWQNIGFGDGFWAVPDPTDDNLVYLESQGGNLARWHRRTGETKFIAPPEPPGEKLRFNWNSPIAVGRKNPANLYFGAQYLFLSRDKGESWTRISPDLTTNDPTKQKQEESGGLTVDNTTAENHCTIFTISESPLDEKVIWVGTDDGNLQVTRDGGRTWTNVVRNIPGLPPNTWCSCVEASRFAIGTAYATFDGHRTGDMATYVYRTDDFGQTWRRITDGDATGFAHVVREDTVMRNLLFLGTEFGFFVSLDRGERWVKFTGGLPNNLPVYDLFVHPREGDVILATHGRGVYIVDDLTPLRRLTPEVLAQDVAFLETRPSVLQTPVISQRFSGDDEFRGTPLPDAAIIAYYLKERHVVGDFRVEIYNLAGELVTTLPGGKRKGINRVEWPTRLKPPRVPRSEAAPFPLPGPSVLEGTYTVKLIKDKQVYTGTITLIADPTSPHRPADRRLKQQTQLELYALLERLAYVDAALTDARDTAQARAKGLPTDDTLAKQLTAFADRCQALRASLVATREGGITGEEQLREKLADLYGKISYYGGRPSASQLALVEPYRRAVEQAEAQHKALVDGELAAVNAELKKRNLAPIEPLTREAYDKR